MLSESNLFECTDKKPTKLLKHFQNLLNYTEDKSEVEKIPSHSYKKRNIIGDTKTVVRLIKSKWFCIQDIILNSNKIPLEDVVVSRLYVNQTLNGFIEGILAGKNLPLNSKIKKQILIDLNSLISCLGCINKLKDSAVLKGIRQARHESCLLYHFFHALLEIHYYIFVILSLVCDNTLQVMETHLQVVIKSIFVIHRATTECCQCLNNFWLVIQLLIEKSTSTQLFFWDSFNKALEKQDSLNSLCFLKEVANIQRFDSDFEDLGSKCERIKSNYEFLEIKFKELLSEGDSESLVIGLKLIEPMINDLWLKEGRINIFQIGWDFYSKRLNISKQPSKTAPTHMIETLDKMMFCPKESTEDFELFVGLLLVHLREFPINWGKIKGRIYSQLGPNKVKDLSDTGIRHVLLLYMALGSIQFEEVEKKMLAFLNNLPTEKKYTTCAWNMYSSLIIKYIKDERSIEKLASPIHDMLQEASTNRKFFYLIKEFLKNLEVAINLCSNFQLYQWCLFGPWLARYQSVCHFADLNQSLTLVSVLLEKCSNADSWSYWEDFFINVYCTVKKLATTSNPLPLLGRIAGKLAVCHNALATDAFQFFTSDATSPKISSDFLECILENYPNDFIIMQDQEVMILKCWVKICFLSEESQSKLTKNVIKLDIFDPLLKNCLKESDKPLENFVTYMRDCSKKTHFHLNNEVILRLCDLAFGDLDKILLQYLIGVLDNELVVLQIYKYVAIIFLKLGHIIYNSSKSVTILTKLVQVLLLPIDFLMGKKTLHQFILNAIRKTWSIYFSALISLNEFNDPYLERTLKDMVVKFLPYFPTSDSPIVICLTNEMVMAEVILEKINNSYFKSPAKETDANLLKALKIISDVAINTSSLELFKLIITKTLHGLFNIVIFHSQRSSAISVIKHITNSSLLSEVKQEFRQVILTVTEKYMALNTTNYFQLMMHLAKFIPEDIRAILGEVSSQVAAVEKLRGVGFDKTLRLQLEKLENALGHNK